MFNKILIANRGEIACRVIHTAHKLGIQCVAVYSEADTDALHVKLADEAYCIGPAPAAESYLRGDKILEIAKQSGAQAIHPGYGFLSENAEFAEKCAKAKIVFIGPPANAIRAMGSKSEAKKIMAKAGVPLVPGYHEDAQDLKTLQKAADKIGYPVLLKAVAGGGGKGMRIVHKAEDFATALAATKREAKASFGDDHVLIEKYLTKPRHVEIQIFADNKKHVVYLFERDCSIQRRHQKIIEEAPAPGMTDKLRKQMGEAAIEAARAIGYIGAGTIEFLLDDDGKFYFMEMNTRLQVEHPVTEMITGQDLVEWQLKVANGEALPLKQNELKINGHAFEARIYAEDPNHEFLPSIGLIKYLKTPHLDQHVRIDTGITQGDTVSQYYDPMIAKLVAWDIDRDTALQRLNHALHEYQIVGVTTNLDLLTTITNHSAFTKGKFDTGFIPKHEKQLFSAPETTNEVLALAALYVLSTQKKQSKYDDDPWKKFDSWRLNLPAQQTFEFQVGSAKQIVLVEKRFENYLLKFANNKSIEISGSLNSHSLTAILNNHEIAANIFADKNTLHILTQGKRCQLIYVTNDTAEHIHEHGAETKAQLASPMPGKIVALLVNVGDQVAAGTGLAIIEAMKMEHTIHAPTDGVIKEWFYKVGDLVNEGVELMVFEEK